MRYTAADMEGCIARFRTLHGGTLAFIDQRIPGYQRRNINIIGLNVTQNVNAPEMAPNIPTPAYGFSIAMAECEPGQGASLHSHPTEEVFMPLGSRWSIFWLNGAEQEATLLEPFDVISVPIGLYRGFRNVGKEKATILAVIGGPDPGKVSFHPSVIDEARAHGLDVDDDGVLREIPPSVTP